MPDFTITESYIYSKSEELNKPAVKLEAYDDSTLKFSRWIFYNFPDYHQSMNADIDFKLIGFGLTQYTGLQVVEDPGVVVVRVGCGLLMIGIMLSFFISHRRIWVISKERDRHVLGLAGGLTSKNKLDFEQEFEDILRIYSESSSFQY